MIAAVVAALIVGCLLAIVADMSVALVLLRGWELALPLSGERRPLAVFPRERLLRGPFLLLGTLALGAAYLVAAVVPISLGGIGWALNTVVLAVASVWASGIVIAVARSYAALTSGPDLLPGDPDYDFVAALATKSNMRFRSMRVIQNGRVEEWPHKTGILVLSEAERLELTPEERQIVLTQRLGTLQYTQSVNKQALIRMAITLLVTLLLGGIVIHFYKHAQPAWLLFFGPFWNIVIFGHQAKRNKYGLLLADQFALDATGDYAKVEAALRKDFLLNRSASSGSAPVSLISSRVEETLEERMERLDLAAEGLRMLPDRR